MSAAGQAAPYLNRAAVADALDEARLLIEVASMAVTDFAPDRRTAGLRILLDLIDNKLSGLSETILPGGGA